MRMVKHPLLKHHPNFIKGDIIPDDSDIEYFPISPTLTRIRIHKNKPLDEILCYPITVHHNKPPVFSTYKRTAPSSISIPPPPPPPPSPPKRKSSRNSHTLKLISTMTIHSPKPYRRHETCFKTLSDKSNVKFLRDKITCKLKPHSASSKGIKITKTVTTPKDTITSTLCTFKDGKVKCKTDVSSDQHYSRSTLSSSSRRCCRHCSYSVPPKVSESPKSDIKDRGVSLERTFGAEKRKVDLVLPKMTSENRFKLVKDLTSPTEVKKAQQKHIFEEEIYPPGTIVKKSTTLLSSAKNDKRSDKTDKSLNVTVAFSPKGRELLKPATISKKSSKSPIASPILSRSRTARSSPVPSVLSDKSKSSIKSKTTSVDSLPSPLPKRKITKSSSTARSKSTQKEEISSDKEKKKLKKLKKDQNNEEIKKEKKSKNRDKTKEDKTKLKKCAGRTAGTEILKKLKKMENPDKNTSIAPTKEEILQAKQMLESESFFQHLFLRDISSPTPSTANKTSWITEKSKIFEQRKEPLYMEPSIGALKVYLSNRKPVSESKFKNYDREIMRSRSVSPSVRNFMSFDSISEVSNEEYPEKISKQLKRSSSLPVAKIIFSEKDINANDKTYVRKSISPIRSPSCRKIQSVKASYGSTVEGKTGVKRKPIRARSAGEADTIKRELADSQSLCQSTASLSLMGDPYEYKNYISETRHTSKKSERFKELNRFYSSLERLGQLERTTSSTDLRPRGKNEEEIIDYDRWMQVRTRERAEQEFNDLYKKLKHEQREKDLLFRTRDVENFRWSLYRDRGLRTKEKSVENIKELFEKLKDRDYNDEISQCKEIVYNKDVYKPLWRGSSVLNLATKMAEKRSKSESRVLTAKQRLMYSEKLLTKEIGSRLWSSLSMEQVSAIRNQLAEIYSQAPPKRQVIDHSIVVTPVVKKEKPNSLVVRRNSENEISSRRAFSSRREEKSASVGKLSNEPVLSELEKRKLSQSLSQEVRDRISQKQKFKTALSVVLGKETRGAVAAAQASARPTEISSPRTCYSLEMSEDDFLQQRKDKDFVLVLTDKNDNKEKVQQTLEEWAQPKSEPSTIVVSRVPSISETESASSDTSTKTAIFLGNKDEKKKVDEKIEYFESGADIDKYVPTIYKPAEDDAAVDDLVTDTAPPSPKEKKTNLSHVTSQSYADLKELFGEQELMKFATVPLSATRKESYVPPQKPQLRISSFSPSKNSNASSVESIYRSRSMSPDTEKYWMAYLALVKGGDVRRLAEKFEHLKDYYTDRRCTSDPEITRTDKYNQEFGDVYWLTTQYENLSRGRSRTRRGQLSPIPKSPLRAEDRFMPHINIISKLASLYPKKCSNILDKQKNIRDLAKALGCPIGEVEKLREKFDTASKNMSILGHMFTSSPNLHELRDIAPYLTGTWVAHRYPKVEDNTKPLDCHNTDKTLVNKCRRPKSESPPRSNKTLSSILKIHQSQTSDIFGNQTYNPSIHQPSYRYRPPSPRTDRGRSWSPKHTVKFKGGHFYINALLN